MPWAPATRDLRHPFGTEALEEGSSVPGDRDLQWYRTAPWQADTVDMPVREVMNTPVAALPPVVLLNKDDLIRARAIETAHGTTP
ncbi:hypothetical protein BKN51_20160 [Amycolatopsis sp. BJA-103]|nr:hypothetical protein BKN51_20160 [Amycolatopsis sp. BJA-103]